MKSPVAYDAYKAQIEDIKNAKEYVYLEYHAIETKEAFEPLHEALKERAAAGVQNLRKQGQLLSFA